ncbi:hypothetical protein DWD63_22845 [Salmonella enterica]|nr:hypothetical protein [Salmonella enterica]EBY8517395.1 hypothetical protein [Salmonella enterica subsp. enterica serovar Braenderup]EHI9392795.1 hypothetical protein [Salmonella enterica subsp. enterica serovar Braenderup]
MKLAKSLIASAIVTGLSVSSAFAAAVPGASTGPDYTSLTNGFDWSSTTAALMAVGAGAVTMLLVVVGMRKVFQFVRAL